MLSNSEALNAVGSRQESVRAAAQRDERRGKSDGLQAFYLLPCVGMIAVLEKAPGERSASPLPDRYPELKHLLFNCQYTA